MNRPFTIALVGNPNCGKTTLFNRLTGTHQSVGNWPGVTVERKTGSFTHEGCQFLVVDLPGTFSLHVSRDDDALDQQIAQAYVLAREADLIVNIIDASSIGRGLYLSSQLFDAAVPVVVALNMIDVAQSQGLHVDPHRLEACLGCPVVPLVASRGDGVRAKNGVRLAGELLSYNPQLSSISIPLAEGAKAAGFDLTPKKLDSAVWRTAITCAQAVTSLTMAA